MSAVLVALVLMLALTGLGRPLVRSLGVNLTAVEAWALAPILGCLPLAIAVQTVGTWTYTPLSMGVVLATSLTAALVGLVGDRGAVRVPVAKGTITHCLAAGCLALVLMAAVAALAPPADHDTLRYHLALPRRDLEFGQLRLLPGWSVYEFFPPLMSLLTRLVYAVSGPSGAQMLNVALTALAAAWAGLLARRLGGSPEVAWLAALFFLAQRVVINLAPSVGVDLPLAGFVAAAATVGLALNGDDRNRHKTAVLLGVVLAAVANTKYHGMIAVAGLLAAAVAAAPCRRRLLVDLPVAGALAGLAIVPLLLRNWLATGNPIFPVAHQLFGPDNIDIFGHYTAVMAARTYVPDHPIDLLWTMFVNQNAFDGLQFGFPILLVALPFAFAANGRVRAACMLSVLFYGVAWWMLMPHLLRFLLPVLAVMAALAALGIGEIASTTRTQPWFRPVFAASMLLAAFVQMSFVASSAVHRLPAAFGLKDARQMLESPAFVYYSLVSPCQWLEENLRQGERYLALVNDPSAICPQAAAMRQVEEAEAPLYFTHSPLPVPSAPEFARRLEAENVRYLLAAPNLGVDDEPLVFGKHRFDALVRPLLQGLTPLHSAPSGSVYATEDVIARLREAGVTRR